MERRKKIVIWSMVIVTIFMVPVAGSFLIYRVDQIYCYDFSFDSVEKTTATNPTTSSVWLSEHIGYTILTFLGQIGRPVTDLRVQFFDRRKLDPKIDSKTAAFITDVKRLLPKGEYTTAWSYALETGEIEYWPKDQSKYIELVDR